MHVAARVRPRPGACARCGGQVPGPAGNSSRDDTRRTRDTGPGRPSGRGCREHRALGTRARGRARCRSRRRGRLRGRGCGRRRLVVLRGPRCLRGQQRRHRLGIRALRRVDRLSPSAASGRLVVRGGRGAATAHRGGQPHCATAGRPPRARWLVRAALTVAAWSWPWNIGLVLPLSLLLLPDGRLPSARWRPFAVAIAVTAPLFVAESGLSGDSWVKGLPDGPGHARQVPRLDTLWTISELRWAVSLLLGVAALAMRYRGGDERLRRQLLWLVAAAGVVLVAVTPWALVAGTPVAVLFSIPLLPSPSPSASCGINCWTSGSSSHEGWLCVAVVGGARPPTPGWSSSFRASHRRWWLRSPRCRCGRCCSAGWNGSSTASAPTRCVSLPESARARRRARRSARGDPGVVAAAMGQHPRRRQDGRRLWQRDGDQVRPAARSGQRADRRTPCRREAALRFGRARAAAPGRSVGHRGAGDAALAGCTGVARTPCHGPRGGTPTVAP